MLPVSYSDGGLSEGRRALIQWRSNPYNAKICLYHPWRPKGFDHFEIIINVLVSSFRFIWIPMFWVCYKLYIFCLFFLFRGPSLYVKIWRQGRQILAYKGGPRAVSPYNAEICLYKPWRPKDFVQFEIIIHILVSYFRIIWIPMLWVYGRYKYFTLLERDRPYRHQNLTDTYIRFWFQTYAQKTSNLMGCDIYYSTNQTPSTPRWK